jgi:3-phosphoshikimate 1-carboxyvinyltransferase
MSLENLPYKIGPLDFFDKEINLPSSKSHSNRALIIGAIRGGNFKVHNVSDSTDVTNMIAALKKIGLKLKIDGATVVFLNSFPECEIDTQDNIISLATGDGGTTNRFLIALLARGKKEYHLFPTEKMSDRPIEDLIQPLKKLNVHIERHENSDSKKKAWVILKGPASLYNTTKLEIDCQKSTQFATALMLAFSNIPLQFEFVNLHASESYLKMTSAVIQKCLDGNSYTVPVDFSSLGYPAALAVLMGRVLIRNCLEIDSLQADSIFIEMLKICGAATALSNQGLEIKKGTKLKPFSFSIGNAPDLFPTLVFLAAHIEGKSTFSELSILQFKESDRLLQMIAILKSFGVDIDFNPDQNILIVMGKSNFKYKKAAIHPARDHRIVMAAALFMAKNSGGELYEVDCIEKSFSDFLSLVQ